MDNHDQEWGRKGATLSDKTACKEYGLTEDEIIDAMNAGSLDYRVGSVYRTPWFRLLRREVEHLVEVRRGRRYLDEQARRLHPAWPLPRRARDVARRAAQGYAVDQALNSPPNALTTPTKYRAGAPWLFLRCRPALPTKAPSA